MASSPARALDHQAPPPAPVALPVDLPAHLAATVAGDLAAGNAVRTSSLAAALAAVPDPRQRRGRRHELSGVLAIGACACLTGASSYVAIGEWAAAQGQAVLNCLGGEAELPSESTVRRCLQDTDAVALDAAVAGGAGEPWAGLGWGGGRLGWAAVGRAAGLVRRRKRRRGAGQRRPAGDRHRRQD